MLFLLAYGSQWEADALLQWFDNEPSLRVAIITGSGKSFCAGQDLIEQRDIANLRERQRRGEKDIKLPERQLLQHPHSGFAGISRRQGKKPIIAAVNGWAMGGGFEICLGCDMIVASPQAQFALPEASRGLYAAAGGLSRLVRLAGITIASEVAMAGRVLSAEEAAKYLIVNKVTKSHESLLEEAVQMATKVSTVPYIMCSLMCIPSSATHADNGIFRTQVASLSPDAIVVTRHGLRQSWETGSVERASQLTEDLYGAALRDGDNLAIGLRAFADKKQPKWVPSKL